MTRARPQVSLEDARGHENRLGLPPRSSLVHDWPPPSQTMGTRGKDIRDAMSDLSCYKPWRRQRERRHLSARGFALCLQPRTNQQPSDRADDQNYCKGPGPKTGVPILRMESKGQGNVYSFFVLPWRERSALGASETMAITESETLSVHRFRSQHRASGPDPRRSHHRVLLSTPWPRGWATGRRAGYLGSGPSPALF